ncbi:2-C-methyl-D-erythritol 4-phosphate cytidylyltransferase [Acaricomes phytoseiuli]|uniref:2-C-methyl-D-erythritol 4-phosphate cytidylyltransferase n=1 Tax=Acaricomes phytoseiuli TaxID=291968 RepID=UPI0022228B84|nr:2-C-methyl-D-erythritol 4-phosphate cytidylyltransferase [Acaricomes phytoseiuli]MCW1250606.1 2-C-methyl-D-erythritol 4-phosphate cytidylyltransferase [Acaricomes phytoseiuli]
MVLVAAGRGERLGHGIPKASVLIAGEPILAHALRAVMAADIAEQICVVLPPGEESLAELCRSIQTQQTAQHHEKASSVLPVIFTEGGASRTESVGNALAALGSGISTVLIHDAARPLTPAGVFQRVHAALRAGAHAVIPALPVPDTIKIAQPTDPGDAASAELGRLEQVTGTVARDQLRRVQTPQGFDLHTLRQAHTAGQALPAAQAAAITDDAMLVESLGFPVYLVPGSELSLKITTPDDLTLAEALLVGLSTPQGGAAQHAEAHDKQEVAK